ncbi:MAG: division/cell wall cluster transcriptional repressor MraZ [Nitrospirales bacterium]|nr:division/cell wall cluster transcriptional repressor MraZ [Nitrospirales bacterium]
MEKSGAKWRVNVPSFLGKYYYTLDTKGRLIIPAPLRNVIAQYSDPRLYITNAPFDKCLHIYPLEEWSRQEDRIRSLPRTDPAVKYFLRRVAAAAVECEIDKQGRLMIPYEQRQDAGISGDVVIVGQLDKIEIWDKAEWDSVTDPSKIDAKAFETALSQYGL